MASNKPWVVVTGSTSGIGWALALQFAKRGFNLVLHGRSEDKLKGKLKTVQDLYPKVEVKLLVRDLNKCAEQGFFEGVKKEFQGMDIAVLVNNAGVVGTILGNDKPELNHQCVLVNCMAQSMMTHYFVNDLNSRKARSAVIDVSSIASMAPTGIYPLYSASKAFNRFLTLGTALSGRFSNIDWLSLTPSRVDTPILTGLKKSRIFTTADETAEGTLRGLGNVTQTYGTWKHIVHGVVFEGLFCNLPQKVAEIGHSIFEKVTVIPQN